MLWDIFVLSFFVTSPVLTAVVTELDNICRNENLQSGDLVLTRTKRQSTCAKDQHQCRDGSCIVFHGKCDGVVDCADGSDESHALCRNDRCPANLFQCTYGACVDGTAPCNGVQECADNSDELLPRCRNETIESKGRFQCQNNETISSFDLCDGIVNCADGSDETVRSCAASSCPSYLFQCAYGACVDHGSNCNGIIECADGSDELNELCEGKVNGTIPAKPNKICILPPYPDHGHYAAVGAPRAAPGQAFYSVKLNYTCNPGYGINGQSSSYCLNGEWFNSSPECARVCKLNNHPSIEYRCQITGNSTEGTRACNHQEPSGTVVTPVCRAPNYYYASGVLNLMRCIEGGWNYVAVCSPGLIKNGTKITILVKDRIKVRVSDIQYYVPIFAAPPVTPVDDNIIIDSDVNSVDSDDNPVDSDDNPVESDIDQTYWRTASDGRSGGVNININDGEITVKWDGFEHKYNYSSSIPFELTVGTCYRPRGTSDSDGKKI